ncbi:MAG: GDP-L-fucose synthase [Gammaproteobacteria bacterium]|nr:GDP-L-fucose synthase [Gammaproteobacteria bacterium]
MSSKSIYVAGHNGMVGAAIVKRLVSQGGVNLIVREKAELDLLDQTAVRSFFVDSKIDEVYLAAARVGGIHANNSYPADFIYQNLTIQGNVIEAAHRSGVQKMLFLGSSCIYPRDADQPMSEAALLSGCLEQTNEPYAIAKIAGIKMCESYNRQHGRDYRCVMPTNLYGENDNFHPENSHVIPGMMRRFHEAKLQGADSVAVWGSGKPRREFLHVDDLAAACVYLMHLPEAQLASVTQPRCSHINIGTGQDCSIAELAETMARVVGFKGALGFDTSKPDGTPRKLLDVQRLAKLGWQSQIGLDEGLTRTYQWMLAHEHELRGAA